MSRRFNKGDAASRFRKYQESLRINDHNLIRDSITHCIHLAKGGASCALIIDSMEDHTLVYSILQAAISSSKLPVTSNGKGGTLLTNGAQIRILVIGNAYMVPLLMPEGTQILHVKDGDPRAKKAREVFDL